MIKKIMNKSNETLNYILIGILLFNIVIGIIGSIAFKEHLQYAIGIIIGGVTAVIYMIHLNYSIERALDMSSSNASKFTNKMHFIRVGIVIIALVISFYFGKTSFFGSLVGIMSFKVAIYMRPLTIYILKILNKGR